MPLTLYGDADLQRATVRLAERLALSASYDTHYLAVAERLDVELWTADRRLVQAVQDTLPYVRLLIP